MIVERFGERKAQRDAIVVACARIAERGAQRTDVGFGELRRLEIGESPPRHARMRLRCDDAAIFGCCFVGAVGDAQLIGEQRARGEVIGRQTHGFAQRIDRFGRPHAAHEQHAEVVPRERERGLELATAAQRSDRVIVSARVRENRAERVLIERIARPLLGRAAHREDRHVVTAAQAFDTREKTQHFGLPREARGDRCDLALGFVDAARFERVRGGHDVRGSRRRRGRRGGRSAGC